MLAETSKGSVARIFAARQGFAAWARAQRSDIIANADRAAKGDAEARRALHALAHRLHGTSGTLSFDALVEPARQLEVATRAEADCDGIALAAARLTDQLTALKLVIGS